MNLYLMNKFYLKFWKKFLKQQNPSVYKHSVKCRLVQFYSYLGQRIFNFYGYNFSRPTFDCVTVLFCNFHIIFQSDLA